MNKKAFLYILLDLVFLVVFNIVFFVIGGVNHVASVWIAYGFIHFAYLMTLVTVFLVRKSSSAAVFGVSLHSISAGYFLVEFVVGLIFIFIGSKSYKASLVTQVIIAGIYAVILLANLIANEHTADSVAKHEAEVAYIKNTAAELQALIGKAANKKANKEVEKAYDVVHASPTKSTAAVRSLEAQIYCKVTDLRNAVTANDTEQIVALAQEVVALTEERNRKLKLPNG